MFSQSSLIASPLVLSAIYSMSHDAIYYFSMIFSVIAALLMLYVSTWPNGKMLGKQGNTEKMELPVVEQKVEDANCQKGCANVEQEKDKHGGADSSAVDMSNHEFSAVSDSPKGSHDTGNNV